MGLYEFLLPETSQAESMARIARSQERNARVNEESSLRYVKQNYELGTAIQNLENDVGTIALLLAAMLKKLEEKGQITREELKDVLTELDLLDNIRDGKISVENLRKGEF